MLQRSCWTDGHASPASGVDAIADDPVTDQLTRCGSSPHLALSARGRPPRCRVRVRGELDLATAPALVTLLDGLREAGVCYLALDLRELEFLGASGLRVLVRADRQFRAGPGWLVLTHPTGHTRRLLQLTGLDSTLTVHPYRGHPDSETDSHPETVAGSGRGARDRRRSLMAPADDHTDDHTSTGDADADAGRTEAEHADDAAADGRLSREAFERRRDQVVAALDRLAHGVFGRCAVCGTQIDDRRLRIAPDLDHVAIPAA